LKGVTRKKILELARGVFEVQERKLTLDELWEADEAFISGTTKHIIPVVIIDGHSIGGGEVGECTKELTQVFEAYIETL
jgi:branched-subunit amino acid aminotransferase/4-amino-4-deoxychorismate lyase